MCSMCVCVVYLCVVRVSTQEHTPLCERAEAKEGSWVSPFIVFPLIVVRPGSLTELEA